MTRNEAVDTLMMALNNAKSGSEHMNRVIEMMNIIYYRRNFDDEERETI